MSLKKHTVFFVISAPGAFEIEIKHCFFKPAISAPYLLMSNHCFMNFIFLIIFLQSKKINHQKREYFVVLHFILIWFLQKNLFSNRFSMIF